MAGLSEARGQAIVSLDGDLQHPPEMIPELFARWREGYKVVTTERADAEDTSLFKRTTSRWFYGVFSKLTGVSMAPGNSDFRSWMSRRCARCATCTTSTCSFAARSPGSAFARSPALPGQQALQRHQQVQPEEDAALRLGRDLVVLARAAEARHLDRLHDQRLAVAELVYILVQYFLGHTVTGWASMMAFMSLMFGILFVLLGVIGTYLGKIFELLKNRPRFLIGERAAHPE